MSVQPLAPLSARDAKVLALASLGGALEFYDFVVYVFFATTLSQLFFPVGMSQSLRDFQSFGIFAAGYLARPLGGIVMAHFGDLVGRKRMFMLSVLLMAVPTFAIGLLPTFSHIGFAAPVLLLSLRMLQGAAIGGEVPGAWVFASEHVSPARTGLWKVNSETFSVRYRRFLDMSAAAMPATLSMRAIMSPPMPMQVLWPMPRAVNCPTAS